MTPGETSRIPVNHDFPVSSKPILTNQFVLSSIYKLFSSLCLFMFIWTVLFPSTYLIGLSSRHDDFVISFATRFIDGPIEFLTKWDGQNLVKLTHVLPSAIWSLAAPLQFHPRFRNSPRTRAAHRYVGYAFMGASLLMTLGFFVAMAKGLFYEHHSFSELPPLNFLPIDDALLIQILMVVFFLTAVVALREARRKNFVAHRRYLIRHVECSLWVAIQRLMVLTNFLGLYKSPLSRREQREIFACGGYLGMVITFGCGEWAICLLEMEEQRNRLKSAKKF